MGSGIVPAVAGTRAILLMGPTATGKSDAALHLAQALDGEIISVDSALVYRGMDVGTAKPDAATLRAVPHHLINIRDPDQNYSCAAFRRDALECIAAVARRGRIPILTGGTMLYFKALTQGLSALPEANVQLRAQITERAQRLGWPALHAELARLDPVSARRLAPNDAQRIQRALEVYYLSGAPMSAQLGAAPESASASMRYLRCALLPSDRARLHERIAARFDAMLAAGLVEEVRALRARYRLDAALPAMRCVGYRQVWRYLEGESDHAAMRAQAIAATRQLAKRQMTWLRSTLQVRGFDCFSPGLRQDLLGWARGALESAGGEPREPLNKSP